MGMYLHLVAALLERRGDEFVQRNEVSLFDDVVYVAWCRSPRGETPGWETQADGTLQVQYRADCWGQHLTHQTSPVDLEDESGVFAYTEMFDLPAGEPGLFHLVLPPHHLPRPATLELLPDYVRTEGDRLVMGWIRQFGDWIRFTFEKVEPDTFIGQAANLRRSITRRRRVLLEQEAELASVENQLRTWHGNRRFLEEQAANYGLRIPVDLQNDLQFARTQIANLEERREALRCR